MLSSQIVREPRSNLPIRIAAYPLTLLEVGARAMQRALESMAGGAHPAESERLSFAELRALVGFDAYDEEAKRYRSE